MPVHDAGDPDAEAVEQRRLVFGAREIVADLDRRPLRPATCLMRGDPRGHLVVARRARGEVHAAAEQPLGERALPAPAAAEDERQAHAAKYSIAFTAATATADPP